MSQPLLLIGVGLIIMGAIIVLLVPSMGLLMLASGGSLIFAYYKSPQGKKEIAQSIAQSKAEKEAAIERGKLLEQHFQQLSNNPSNTESLEYILNNLASQNKKSLKNCMRPIVIPLLKLRPLDSAIRETVFAYAKKTITISIVGQNEASSKDIYEAALEVLSQHPDQISLKQYALEIGRWHYGIQRPSHKVTIYDEQAIQNDIAVRSR